MKVSSIMVWHPEYLPLIERIRKIVITVIQINFYFEDIEIYKDVVKFDTKLRKEIKRFIEGISIIYIFT